MDCKLHLFIILNQSKVEQWIVYLLIFILLPLEFLGNGIYQGLKCVFSGSFMGSHGVCCPCPALSPLKRRSTIQYRTVWPKCCSSARCSFIIHTMEIVVLIWVHRLLILPSFSWLSAGCLETHICQYSTHVLEEKEIAVRENGACVKSFWNHSGFTNPWHMGKFIKKLSGGDSWWSGCTEKKLIFNAYHIQLHWTILNWFLRLHIIASLMPWKVRVDWKALL